MNKQNIKTKLIDNHQSFIRYIDNLTVEEFLLRKNEKWTAGQQLQHIYLSVKPVSLALHFPKFILKLIWGKANRKSKTYEELVTKYKLKLQEGGRATGRFIPKTVSIEKRTLLQNKINNEVVKICASIDRITEDDLDMYILPHPLLGKLTLREMLYFTIYHVMHHEVLTKQNIV